MLCLQTATDKSYSLCACLDVIYNYTLKEKFDQICTLYYWMQLWIGQLSQPWCQMKYSDLPSIHLYQNHSHHSLTFPRLYYVIDDGVCKYGLILFGLPMSRWATVTCTVWGRRRDSLAGWWCPSSTPQWTGCLLATWSTRTRVALTNWIQRRSVDFLLLSYFILYCFIHSIIRLFFFLSFCCMTVCAGIVHLQSEDIFLCPNIFKGLDEGLELKYELAVDIWKGLDLRFWEWLCFRIGQSQYNIFLFIHQSIHLCHRCC